MDIDNLLNQASNIDLDQATNASEQVFNGASDTVKTISDYFGVDTLIIWAIALIAIILVWRIFRKLGKIALILIILAIIAAAIAGPFFI